MAGGSVGSHTPTSGAKHPATAVRTMPCRPIWARESDRDCKPTDPRELFLGGSALLHDAVEKRVDVSQRFLRSFTTTRQQRLAVANDRLARLVRCLIDEHHVRT